MPKSPRKLENPIRLFNLPGLRHKILGLTFALLLPVSVHACPDLTPFYPGDNPDWSSLSLQLISLMPECLESPEYFALLGAAQLNSGDVAESLETLERALLLEPDNGAAQIDYAQALYLQGQLFSALELNSRLLRRDDLPANLQPLLQDRQQSWQALTRQGSIRLDLLAGYDNNLNSAPDPGQITLTLSGEPVLLALNPEFRPLSGPYMNFRLGGRYRQLAPGYQHNWLLETRGRVSEDTKSDLLQVDSRYAFIRPDPQHSWQLTGGISHLLFGGSSLYTATEISSVYQPQAGANCRPYFIVAAQHQLFHDQSRLNALESKATAGTNCPYSSSLGAQQLGLEVGLLNNAALKAGRPGGDRNGWQTNVNWQLRLRNSQLRSQLSYTRQTDTDGYSPLLENGAERWLERSYVFVQFRQPLSYRATLLINLFHQRQRSNIELFDTTDSTFEIGVSLEL